METERRHGGILNHIVDIMGPQLRTATIERLISKTEVIYEAGFNQEYRSAIETEHFPIVISNHQAHIDGLTISVLTKILLRQANEILLDGQKTKGFLLPVATSLTTGDQDAGLKVLYDTTRPIMERNGLFPVNLTRSKDIINYGLPQNFRDFFSDMMTRIDQGYKGVVIFPEGSVQAGRRKKDGKIHGMQAFEEGSIKSMVFLAKARSKKIIFIPVAITGGPDIFNQDKNSPNLKAFKALFPGVSSDIKISIGRIVKSTDEELLEIIKDGIVRDSKKLDDFFGLRIASMLPNDEQGVYRV